MIRPLSAAALGLAACLVFTAGCMEPLEVVEANSSMMTIGETRSVELRYLRLDIRDFEQTLTLDDLRALPSGVTERLWLLDLPIAGGEATPRLIDAALAEIRELDTSTLGPAEANMQSLLTMTAENANLEGTVLESMSQLGSVVGLPSARILADMVGREVDEPYLATDFVADAIVSNVVGSHPAAQTRLGPITADNPAGIYPVTPGTIPVTLSDAINDFTTLSERFGPAFVDGVSHPGFVLGATRARVLGDDFEMTVRANANALPFKGLDLTSAGPASVSSLEGQIETLFDFDDPGWLVIQGLPEEPPTIDELTFQVVEHDGFVAGGRSPEPAGLGDSEIWRMAPWTMEGLIASSAHAAFFDRNYQAEYFLPNEEDEPVFAVAIVDGWVEFSSRGDVGEPPAPAYLWDVVLEIAQTRLHDGGLEEGEAGVSFTLHDVDVGLTSTEVERTLRENIQADPIAFLDLAEELLDTATGAPDFFYVRTLGDDLEHPDTDWLFFVNEADIPLADSGLPERPYSYARPGFFADADLSVPLGLTVRVNGDDTHLKVAIEPGDRLYIEDDVGAVFEIIVGPKPSPHRTRLDVTRVR